METSSGDMDAILVGLAEVKTQLSEQSRRLDETLSEIKTHSSRIRDLEKEVAVINAWKEENSKRHIPWTGYLAAVAAIAGMLAFLANLDELFHWGTP